MKKSISKEEMEQLYVEFKQQLFQYVLSRVRHREVAEDIVSSVFIHFFRYLSTEASATREHHYRGLLYKIAKNQIFNHFRATATHPSVDIEEMDVSDEKHPSPLQEIDQQLSLDIVEKTIEKLPEYYKELIRLRHIAQLEYLEIAELLNKKEGAIRVALHRAIKTAQEIARQ